MNLVGILQHLRFQVIDHFGQCIFQIHQAISHGHEFRVLAHWGRHHSQRVVHLGLLEQIFFQ